MWKLWQKNHSMQQLCIMSVLCWLYISGTIIMTVMQQGYGVNFGYRQGSSDVSHWGTTRINAAIQTVTPEELQRVWNKYRVHVTRMSWGVILNIYELVFYWKKNLSTPYIDKLPEVPSCFFDLIQIFQKLWLFLITLHIYSKSQNY